jgi:hypothetical protein
LSSLSLRSTGAFGGRSRLASLCSASRGQQGFYFAAWPRGRQAKLEGALDLCTQALKRADRIRMFNFSLDAPVHDAAIERFVNLQACCNLGIARFYIGSHLHDESVG